MNRFVIPIAGLLCASSALIAQTPVGAYFSFQKTPTDVSSDTAAYSAAVSRSTFSGTPTFSAGGSRLGNFSNFGSNFTAFDGSVWTPARCVGWNADGAASTNNTWQVTLNTTSVTDMSARFRYRLNGVQSGAAPVTSLSAFEYRIGSGAFQPVPGASLTLANNTTYSSSWVFNLAGLAAIENQAEVTLRWSLPDLDAVTGTQVRMDDLQISGTLNPPGLVWVTPAQLPQARVATPYSGNVVVGGGTSPHSYALKSGSTMPNGLSLSSGGGLSGSPSSVGSYQFTITATDSSIPPKTLDRQFSLEVSRARALPEGNYNVLFIAFDDLKANFGAFVTPELAQQMPKPITPNLDSLAARGMSFTRTYCQQPVCWASRASLLTGVRPDTAKIWDGGVQIRDTMPGIITLPQHFAEQGYSVARYGKIFDSSTTTTGQDAAFSWPDGYDDFFVSSANSGSAHHFYEDGHWQTEQAAAQNFDARRKLFATDAGVTNFWVTPNRPVNPDADYVDGMIATAAITKLNTFATNYTNIAKPFFLGVGFAKPHLPFVSPKSYWDLYDPAQIKLTNHVNGTAYTGTRTVPRGTLPFTAASYEISGYDDIPSVGVTSESQARQLIHGYLAATSFADYQLGRVLAALNANPAVASNTIVVIWGDHGWHLGDHNGFWCKHSCYEQAARAPLIIAAPGMTAIGTAGKPCAQPVEFVDIYPTLVDLAVLPSPAQPPGLALQGASLRPLLEDPAQPWKKAAFTQYQRNITGTGVAHPGNGMGYSIRTSRYRYTEWWRTQTTLVNGNSLDRDVKLYSTPEHIELYDMLNDPNETVNQATNSAFASVKAELAAALAGGYGWQTAAVAPPANFPTDFTTWQSSHVEPGYPLGLFAKSMDPDGDGVANLREYAHGTNPLLPEADPTWSEVTGPPGAEFLALVFPLVSSRTDVSTFAKTSPVLSNWTTAGVINEPLSQEANRTWWRSKIPKGGSAPSKGFLRLEFE